jgi:hypothetical protein
MGPVIVKKKKGTVDSTQQTNKRAMKTELVNTELNKVPSQGLLGCDAMWWWGIPTFVYNHNTKQASQTRRPQLEASPP